MTAVTTPYQYDYLVIGGGSGGIASAKRAATLHSARVAIVERGRLGGTCVNVGCVPKKVMWNAAHLCTEMRESADHYGFTGGKGTADNFNWKKLKESRDGYVKRLNGIYENGLEGAGVEFIRGTARFLDGHTLEIDPGEDGGGGKFKVTAGNILVATGGRPHVPELESGTEHVMTSDDFFELEYLPKSAVVIGAGYIAVELAGVLNSLGTETNLVLRKKKALRSFDDMISDGLDVEMINAGILIHRNTKGIDKITLNETGSKTVHLKSGKTSSISGVDVVIMAIGREPNVEGLNLASAGVTLDPKNYIVVDEFSNTTSQSIFALGDVCGNVELTPMAIAAGRRLADRLFGGPPWKNAKVSYQNVPTVVFSHPPIGTIGLTEQQALNRYGLSDIKVYKSSFANLFYGIFSLPKDHHKPKTLMKLICAGENERVVGIHIMGMGADEMMQGFGVAMNMGATKADLDNCVAIHPTASEELVTMGVWGTSPQMSGATQGLSNGDKNDEPNVTVVNGKL